MEMKRIWKRNKIMKENLLKSMGDRCFICGTFRQEDKEIYPMLVNHRKDGSWHRDLHSMKVEDLKVEINSRFYIKLCSNCHSKVH